MQSGKQKGGLGVQRSFGAAHLLWAKCMSAVVNMDRLINHFPRSSAGSFDTPAVQIWRTSRLLAATHWSPSGTRSLQRCVPIDFRFYFQG
jgi:hypothetical protein